MLKIEKFGYDKQDKAYKYSLHPARSTQDRKSGVFSLFSHSWKGEKTKHILHSTSHSFTPPYIPKQRRPLSESQ